MSNSRHQWPRWHRRNFTLCGRGHIAVRCHAKRRRHRRRCLYVARAAPLCENLASEATAAPLPPGSLPYVPAKSLVVARVSAFCTRSPCGPGGRHGLSFTQFRLLLPWYQLPFGKNLRGVALGCQQVQQDYWSGVGILCFTASQAQQEPCCLGIRTEAPEHASNLDAVRSMH